MLEFLLEEKNHPEFDHVPVDIDVLNERKRTPLFLVFTPPFLTYTGSQNGLKPNGTPIAVQPEGVVSSFDWIRPGGPAQREQLVRMLVERGADVKRSVRRTFLYRYMYKYIYEYILTISVHGVCCRTFTDIPVCTTHACGGGRPSPPTWSPRGQTSTPPRSTVARPSSARLSSCTTKQWPIWLRYRESTWTWWTWRGVAPCCAPLWWREG